MLPLRLESERCSVDDSCPLLACCGAPGFLPTPPTFLSLGCLFWLCVRQGPPIAFSYSLVSVTAMRWEQSYELCGMAMENT